MIYMDEVQSTAYYAIIPANVRYDDQLSANAKLLYGEITALTVAEGYCYATNAYFCSLYQMTERTIQRLIKQLEDRGYITIRLLGNPVDKVAFGRRIYIDKSVAEAVDDRPRQKCRGDNFVGVTPTKLSGSHIYQKNNKTQGDARAGARVRGREKKPKDQAARDELRAWAETVTDEPAELAARLMDFCDARSAKRKPLSAGRAVTALTNKLTRYSEGSVPVMLRMLDESIERGWDSVYQLKPDVLREVTEAETSTGEDGGDKWL